MGCCASKNKPLSGHLAKSDYRLPALSDLYKLKRTPQPLEPDGESDGFISPRLFHNLYYSGFYAPYICNPSYLLLLDCRCQQEYNRHHVMLARWRGGQDLDADLSAFTHIILYDDSATGWGDASEKLEAAFSTLRDKGLTPVCVAGGFSVIQARLPYMLTSKVLTINTFRNKYLQWFPSFVDDDLLVGRADQATNPNVICDLSVTHVVCLLGTPLPRVFPHVHYLMAPLSERDDQELLNVLPRIFKFVTDALEAGGRVLVHCDQGVNRAAAVTMAYLMASRGCTLEDSYFYLESVRPVVQPAPHLLRQLSNYEAEVFGRKITNLADLEF